MNLDLTGKRAFVAGSTRAIDLATALGLARKGAQVIVNGLDGVPGQVQAVPRTRD